MCVCARLCMFSEIICFLPPVRITLSTYCTVTTYFLYESESKPGALEKQTVFLTGQFINHAFMNRACWGLGAGDITGKQMCAYDPDSVLPTSGCVGVDLRRSLPPKCWSVQSASGKSVWAHQVQTSTEQGRASEMAVPFHSNQENSLLSRAKKNTTNKTQTTTPRITQLGIREGKKHFS